MTILVSRTWPLTPGHTKMASSLFQEHPHLVNRGSGNAYTYPDEAWHSAQTEYEYLMSAHAPVAEVRYEWVRGYPDGFAFLEGAVCSLDAHPEEFLPLLVSNHEKPRKWIHQEDAQFPCNAA